MKIDKWVALGLVAMFFSPLPAGIVAGYVLQTEKKYKAEGMVILIVSIFLSILELVLSYYFPNGL